MNNINNLGISMRNSADIQAHSISLIKDNRVVSLEDYITEIAGDGGGSGDPVDAYTKIEADALLNAKLNVNNPQDVFGTLRLDPTNGLSKIILNAQNAPNDEDLYVNGSAYVNNGELRAQSMKCDNTLTFASIKGNFISNNDSNTDLKFQINSNDFITLSTANDVIEVDKDIELHSSVLKSNVLDTWSNSSLQIRRFGTNYISLDADDTISISRQSKISSNKADGVDMTISHHNNSTNLFEKKLTFKNGNEIHTTGDGGADEELLLNYYTDYGVRIGNDTDAYLTIKGARNGTDTLTVNGSTYFGGAVSYNGDIVLTNPYQLKTNNISSNGLNDLVFNVDTLGEFFRCQASDFTVRLPNNRSFLSQNIIVDNIQPLAFANDVVLNGGNSTNDAYEEYVRLDASTERVNVSKIIDTSEHIYMNLNKRLYLNDTAGSERYIVSTFRSGTPSFNQLDIVNENSSNGRIRLMINTEENVIIENSQFYSKRVITAVAGVNSNTINTNTDVDLTISRNGNEFLRLDKDDDNIVCSKGIACNTINSNGDNSVNLQQNGNTFISLQGVANRVQVNRLLRVADNGNGIQAQFAQNSNGNYISFQLGNHISAYIAAVPEDPPDPAIPANGNTLHLNYFSHGNVFLGTNQDTGADPIPTITINKFSSGTGNAFEVAGDSVFSGDVVLDTGKSIKTNTINSNGDNDLVFQRDGNDFLRLDKANDNITCSKEIVAGGGIKCNTFDSDGDSNILFKRDGTDIINVFTYTPTNGPSIIIDVLSDCGLSSNWLFANTFANRTPDTNTEFRGAISGGLGSGKVYMTYLHATETLDFDCVIDNTGGNVIGNLINTGVSDKRLRTNIQDIDDANYSDCVKNVKLKTFEFKDEKYKNQDNYGMIAQDLLENLPKEFKSIVRQNIPKKDEDKEYLSINYMKLSVVLWGCCQEQQSKIEHLEASIYEMMEDIKELKGKKTTKPKAKPKSKTKVEK